MAELCKQFELHLNQISDWKRQQLKNAANVFVGDPHYDAPMDQVPLHAMIGHQR